MATQERQPIENPQQFVLRLSPDINTIQPVEVDTESTHDLKAKGPEMPLMPVRRPDVMSGREVQLVEDLRPAEGESISAKARKAAQKVVAQHGETVAARHEAAQQGTHLDKEKGKVVKALVTIGTVLVESIPGGLGPWGIGDIITAIEAVAGHTIDGLKLSWAERGLYILASAIPGVPGRLLVEGYRRWEEHKRKDIHKAVRGN